MVILSPSSHREIIILELYSQAMQNAPTCTFDIIDNGPSKNRLSWNTETLQLISSPALLSDWLTSRIPQFDWFRAKFSLNDGL